MTHPTHVCGMIKPLEWVAGDFCGQPCFYADSEFGVWMVVAYSGLVGRWAYDDPCGNNSDYAWDNAEAAKAAAQADYEARIAAQIQPDAGAQPVASSEAGDLLPCPFCAGKARVIRGVDGFYPPTVECDECGVRMKAPECLTGKLIAAWNRRALPVARAEVSVAEADDLLNIAKDSVEILQVAIDNWNEIHPDEPDEVFTDLQSRCRALTECSA